MATAKTATIRTLLQRSRTSSARVRADGDRASRHLRAAATALRERRGTRTAERLP